MEAQEIFDTVAKHLLKQGRRAVNPDMPEMCQYRGANGTKCAVGVLISDEIYDEMMEGRTINGLVGDVLYALPEWMLKNAKLLADLQAAHDVTYNWRASVVMQQALNKVAAENNLSADVLNELAFPWESKEVI